MKQRCAQVLAGLSATPGQVRLSANYRKNIASAKSLSKRLYWTYYVLLDLTHVARLAMDLSHPILLARKGEY